MARESFAPQEAADDVRSADAICCTGVRALFKTTTLQLTQEPRSRCLRAPEESWRQRIAPTTSLFQELADVEDDLQFCESILHYLAFVSLRSFVSSTGACKEHRG